MDNAIASTFVNSTNLAASFGSVTFALATDSPSSIPAKAPNSASTDTPTA